MGNELRALVRDRQALQSSAARPAAAPRSAGELRARADAIRAARERKQSERQEAERKRRAAEEARARRARLDAISQRGETVWREVESEIERRNASGYDMAAGLLLDLKTIAEEQASTEDFAPAAGDPRTAYSQGALSRTAGSTRIARPLGGLQTKRLVKARPLQ